MSRDEIRLLTKTGTDAWHAQTSFDYGDALFNSRDSYVVEKPPSTLKQYGCSLSSLIDKRLPFFFGLNERGIGNGAVISGVMFDPDTLRIVDSYTQVFSNPLWFRASVPALNTGAA